MFAKQKPILYKKLSLTHDYEFMNSDIQFDGLGDMINLESLHFGKKSSSLSSTANSLATLPPANNKFKVRMHSLGMGTCFLCPVKSTSTWSYVTEQLGIQRVVDIE